MILLDRTLLVLRNMFLIGANILLILMLAANSVNILWRAVAGKAFNAVFPWTMMGFVWLVFLGFYVFVYDRRDVAVDIVLKYLPTRQRQFVTLIAMLISVTLLCVILGSLPDVLRTQADRIDMVGLPRFSMVLPLFASTALVLVILLRRLPELLSGEAIDHSHPPEGAD